MTNRRAFGETLAAMSLAMKMFGRDLTKPVQELYWRALAELSDDDFQAAATLLLRTETDFPTPAQFLAAAHPALSSGAAATRALNALLLLTDYDPEGGNTWRLARIRAELGEATAHAFLAAGGAPGLRDMDSPFHGARLRREFCDAWTAAIQADARAALPQPHLRELPPAPELQPYLAGIGEPLRLTDGLDPPRLRPDPATLEQLEAKRAGYRRLARGDQAAP